MKIWIVLFVFVLILVGCVGKIVYWENCVDQLDVVWKEFDLVKVEGFVGIVSYLKVLILFIGVKIQQQFEVYEGCISKVEKVCFYICELCVGC